jgi:hypothetical protein
MPAQIGPGAVRWLWFGEAIKFRQTLLSGGYIDSTLNMR